MSVVHNSFVEFLQLLHLPYPYTRGQLQQTSLYKKSRLFTVENLFDKHSC